jgi:hypothetical protein
MIANMQQSPGDTFVRTLVMAAALAALLWAANHYTTIPRLVIQRIINWYETTAAAEAGRRSSELANGGTADPATPPIPRLLSNFTAQDAQPLAGGEASLNVDSGSFLRTHGDAASSADRQPSFVRPAAAAPGPGLDRRTQMERRLESLGAVYTLMEMWGRGERRYRFHCRVALAGGAEVTRNFEATGSSPDEVMEQVLSEVEAWWAQMSFAGRRAP